MKYFTRPIFRGIRWFAGLTAAVMAAGLCAAVGVTFAEESEDTTTFDDGILTYTVLSGTEVSVTKCIDTATHVSIMPRIDGYDVVSIGEEAFAECTSLQAVTIPNSVQEIGNAAFYGCTALESLKLPDTVTSIASGTFFNCAGLTELTLGNNVTQIDDMAFGYCVSLESLTLPDSVETLGDQVFYYCTSLESIAIPEKVTELGAYTFYGCMSLQEFEVPASLENLGAMPFFGCRSLETITVEEGNPTYLAEDDVLYSQDKDILYLYPAGRTDTAFTVPDSVLVIYAGAFFAASNLTRITLNADLQYIGEMAFDFCSGLTAVSIPEKVATIGETAFSDCTSLTSVIFEGGEDADTALEIGSYAFFCCDNLKEVTLPKRVSSIGEYAFGCVSPEEAEESSSGDEIAVEAMDGFLLIGYTGAAEDYAKNSEVDIRFKALNFDWGKLVLYVVIAAAVLVILFVAVRSIRHNMMTAEEKKALQEAKELQKTPLSARGNESSAGEAPEELDDGYRGILEEEELEEDLFSYDQILPEDRLHQIGHADALESEEEKTEEK